MPTRTCPSKFLEITDRALDNENKICNFKSGTTRASAREVVLCHFSGMQNCARVACANTFSGSGDHTETLAAGCHFANYMAPDQEVQHWRIE
jgi:hypothetical protein